MKKHLLLPFLIIWAATAQAMVEETGTLRGFVLDTCVTCSYDNWLSHVSEGVARPGYNDYGPSHLDPQTNGFGAFELIPTGAEGDSTLARWKQIFVKAARNEWQAADSLLSLHGTDWDFELVHFTDTELQKEFYIFRELLDFNYID
ncbi:hypothetical protein IT157_02765, partial [bacterium]|nr:hypothetical protein [bacterium]